MKKHLKKFLSKVPIKLSFAAILLVALIYSCTKTEWNLNKTHYVPDEIFFQRNDSLKVFYAAINNSLADENLLNRVIDHFKDFDSRAKIVNEVEKKYGKAYWDISFVLRDSSSLRTVVTPIINSADTVTALIFSSERGSDYTYFRVIDKQTKQTKLREYGDKNATLFTQYTLRGLFGATQSNYNYARKNTLLSKQPSTNSVRVNTFIALATTCWLYGVTGTMDDPVAVYQCSTSDVLLDDDDSSDSDESGAGAWKYSFCI